MKRVLLALVVMTLAAGCSKEAEDSPVIATPTLTASPTTAPPTVVPTTASPTPSPSPSADELSPKPGLESPAPLGRPVCKSGDLTVTDADTLVDASYRKEVFVVRTTGPDCQLKGYPAVQVPGATTQHGGFGLPPEQPQAVTLSRTTTVSFVISSARAGSCRDVPTITVTLPGTTGGHRVATALRVCGAKVGLSPIHRQGDTD